jgi:hypothetical protein
MLENHDGIEEYDPFWLISAWILIAAHMEILPAGLIADEI